MDKTDNSATRQVMALAGRGVRWARTCLDALVNDLAAARTDADGWRALALVGMRETRLFARRQGGIVELATLAPGAAALRTGVDAHLAGPEPGALALRFTGGRAIVQQFSLPQSARPVIGAIVRNKIESLAPWPLDEALWGYTAGDTDAGGTLKITAGVVGRTGVAAILADLAGLGIKPSRVDIANTADAEAPILLDHSSEARRTQVSLMLKSACAGLALIIAAIGAYGGFLAIGGGRELARIEARIDELKRELVAKPGQGSAAGKLAEANRLVERKMMERPLVAVLDALTHVIPDGTWLTAIDLLDRQITVAGRGGPAPQLIQSLESAAAFSAANFASATQRDDQAGIDVFAITAAIEPEVVAE